MIWKKAILVFVLLFLSGCVSPSSSPNSSTQTQSTFAPALDSSVENVGPGDPVTFCNTGTDEENEKCFSDSLSTCEKSIGVFWKTSDGFSLLFETLGLDTDSGNCRVRMTAADSESRYFGQSANCSIPKSPATSEQAQPFFDILSIDTTTCAGTYVDEIVKTPNSI